MSIRDMIKNAGTRCTIKFSTEWTGDGGQLELKWLTRYWNIPCRFNAVKKPAEILYYDKPTTLALYEMYIMYVPNVDMADIVYLGERVFEIKKIDNWDEQSLYLRLLLEELK